MKNPKIKTWRELSAIVKKAGDRTIGFTNGCFDILHLGHVTYLKKAKEACDLLIVGVNSDKSVRRLKGPNRPINNELVRVEVLSALEPVDFITLFKEDTPEKLIKTLTPDVLFKGGDWKAGQVVGGKHVTLHGGKVKIIKYVKGQSTTNIIKKTGKKK